MHNKRNNFITNKMGFTLIEIIVSIVLITVIGVGSFVGVRFYSNNKLEKKMEELSSLFDDALEIYLANHSEVYDNLENNVEGAVVTLEVLKNEGLLNDNLDIDYKNNYYVLSDAVLLSDKVVSSSDACNGQVSISVLKSWKELSDKVDTSDVIYVCPKNIQSSNSVELYNYFPKGGNPNNYVTMINGELESSWRILQINESEIRLIAQDKNILLQIEDYFDKWSPYSNNMLFEKKLNSIYVNDNIIAQSNYFIADYEEMNLQQTFIYLSYVGIVDLYTLENVSANDGNWLENLYKYYLNNTSLTEKLAIGSFESAGDGYFCYYDDGVYGFKYGLEDYRCTPQHFIPVITFDSCVSLFADQTCTNTIGSETCPYILDTSKCA